MIRAVFFDAGDTLVHQWVHKAERLRWLYRQAGIPAPPDPGAMAAASAAQERFFQDRQYHPDTRSDLWSLQLHQAGLKAAGVVGDLGALARHLHETARGLPRTEWLDPEALPLLDFLRSRGLRLAVVSNWDGTLVDTMRTTGLAGYFDAILDSSVVGSRKPDTRMLRIACEATGTAPDEAVMVGDSPGADVAGALAAGIRPVLLDALNLFGGGYHGLPPFDRIERLSQLPSLLNLEEVAQPS